MAESQEYREAKQFESEESSEGDARDDLLRKIERLDLEGEEGISVPGVERTESSEATPETAPRREEQDSMRMLMQALQRAVRKFCTNHRAAG